MRARVYPSDILVILKTNLLQKGNTKGDPYRLRIVVNNNVPHEKTQTLLLTLDKVDLGKFK